MYNQNIQVQPDPLASSFRAHCIVFFGPNPLLTSRLI